MTYEQVKNLKPEHFKRLCGVRSETFAQMVEVIQVQLGPKRKTGRPGKLSIDDQVLMTLEYWREYRTYFHIEIQESEEELKQRLEPPNQGALARPSAGTLPMHSWVKFRPVEN